ncbi:hypothetical protein SCMU_33440 [Sinomonas cyclohexanicum]|uniref:Uncharacterized protein n=1 Tax=Sinomonas cyclohexanicum TaxID=322009 RepID=A0ABM7PZA4_SINCY|nr:hypothetical protein [Corynebacterium cyclohexanicum]BCT77502.1 hypothetical protein SCMU_33440 [Corynebacterium cyclohexanicum]
MLKKLIAALAVGGALAVSGVAGAPTAIGNWPDPMRVQAIGNWPDPMKAPVAIGNLPDPMQVSPQGGIGNWPDPM